MSDIDIRGLSDRIHQTLLQRVGSVSDMSAPEEFARLIGQIRAMKVLSQQLHALDASDGAGSARADVVAGIVKLNAEMSR